MLASAKSVQLQIRVSPAQARRFQELTEACREPERARFALAELSSWLATLGTSELRDALAMQPAGLTPYLANYVAAMLEYACAQRDIPPPAWTRLIAPLTEPVFGSTLTSLRLHLLSRSPAPFRRRNMFLDADGR